MKISRSILFTICLFLVGTSIAQTNIAKHVSPLSKIVKSVKLPENSELQLVHTVSSPFAIHYTFDQITAGKPVKHHGIKVHIKKNGTHVIQDFLTSRPLSIAYTEGDFLVVNNGELQAATKRTIEDSRNPRIQYIREDGLVLIEKDIHKYVKKDTSIFIKVFDINPINSSGQDYGGSFVDANDQSNSSLDSQLFWKEVQAKYSNDSIFLESEFLYFEDISLPNDSFFYATKDSLYYSRDNGAFEYINVYYHINAIGNYVNGLGYDELTDTLQVDVHAFNNWDNSAYTPGLHALEFGEGGIDDAEDGEVVIHEFTHSLSELASPQNTFGREREAMEEGSCDYFAKAYSRSINDNTPNKVFTWDGNESWNGFKINTDRFYPRDLKGSKDEDRDMWSSALMCAHDYIGREAMDSLLLEHFYYQAANTTMAQMAQIILDIDSADFNSRYYSQLKQCFVDAGFVQRGASVDIIKDKGDIKILNQQGFVQGSAHLQVVAPQIAVYSLYAPTGQKLYSETSTLLSLSPTHFAPGLYIVTVEMNNTVHTIKILR